MCVCIDKFVYIYIHILIYTFVYLLAYLFIHIGIWSLGANNQTQPPDQLSNPHSSVAHRVQGFRLHGSFQKQWALINIVP